MGFRDPGASVGLAVFYGVLANLGQTVDPGLDFALNPQARRCARPNRVRYPTDCIFASGCSPPHLAVTQLPSASGSGHLPVQDLHLHDCTCLQAHGFRIKSGMTIQHILPIGQLRHSLFRRNDRNTVKKTFYGLVNIERPTSNNVYCSFKKRLIKEKLPFEICPPWEDSGYLD